MRFLFQCLNGIPSYCKVSQANLKLQFWGSQSSELLCIWTKAELKSFSVLAEGNGDDETPTSRRSFLWIGKDAEAREKKIRIIKGAYYAVQVFYSFFIM